MAWQRWVLVAWCCGVVLAAPRKNSQPSKQISSPSAFPPSTPSILPLTSPSVAPPSSQDGKTSSPTPTNKQAADPSGDATQSAPEADRSIGTPHLVSNFSELLDPGYVPAPTRLQQDFLVGLQSFIDNFAPGLQVQDGMEAFTDSFVKNYVPFSQGEMVTALMNDTDKQSFFMKLHEHFPLEEVPVSEIQSEIESLVEKAPNDLYKEFLLSLLKETTVKQVDESDVDDDGVPDNSIQVTYTKVELDPLGNLFSWVGDRVKDWTNYDAVTAWFDRIATDVRNHEAAPTTPAPTTSDTKVTGVEEKILLPPGVLSIGLYDPFTLGANTALFIIWNILFWGTYRTGWRHLFGYQYYDDYYDEYYDETDYDYNDVEGEGEAEGEGEGEGDEAGGEGEEGEGDGRRRDSLNQSNPPPPPHAPPGFPHPNQFHHPSHKPSQEQHYTSSYQHYDGERFSFSQPQRHPQTPEQQHSAPQQTSAPQPQIALKKDTRTSPKRVDRPQERSDTRRRSSSQSSVPFAYTFGHGVSGAHGAAVLGDVFG